MISMEMISISFGNGRSDDRTSSQEDSFYVNNGNSNHFRSFEAVSYDRVTQPQIDYKNHSHPLSTASLEGNPERSLLLLE